jgi:hypothetical protein
MGICLQEDLQNLLSNGGTQGQRVNLSLFGLEHVPLFAGVPHLAFELLVNVAARTKHCERIQELGGAHNRHPVAPHEDTEFLK